MCVDFQNTQCALLHLRSVAVSPVGILPPAVYFGGHLPPSKVADSTDLPQSTIIFVAGINNILIDAPPSSSIAEAIMIDQSVLCLSSGCVLYVNIVSL